MHEINHDPNPKLFGTLQEWTMTVMVMGHGMLFQVMGPTN